MLAALISIPCSALAPGYRDGRLGIFWLGFGVLWLLVILSGLPIGRAVQARARCQWRTTLWLIGGVTACVGLLSGAIDGRTIAAALLVSGLVELLIRGSTALRALR